MSKTLQTLSPDYTDTPENYVLKIINTDNSSERVYDRYEDKNDLDQATAELKNNGSLSANEEIETEYTGPEVVIENLWISKQDGTGDLIVTAEFQTFDEDGDVTFNDLADEYIDVDLGQIDTYSHGLMRSEPQWGYFDVNKVHEAINEFLYENPIDDRILEDAKVQSELQEAFEDSEHRSSSHDDSRVVHTDVYAADHQVYVAFKVISKAQEDGDDFPTYSMSSIQYAKYDSETESLQLADDFDQQNALNSAEIKSQLDRFLETPEAQDQLQTAIDVNAERRRIEEIGQSIAEGEAVVASVDVIAIGCTLATETTFVVKEDEIAIEITSVSEVDLETGKSANTDQYEDYSVSPDLNHKLNSMLNDYLEANPISDDTLNLYRADAENQKMLAAGFHSGQSDRSSNVAVSNLHIAINADKEVIANFDVIERKSTNSDSQQYRYTEHVMLSETLDIDTKSVVHKSQSSLDYGSYNHDHLREAVSKQIKTDDLLSDRAVASIKAKIGASEDKDEDRVRMIAR